MLRVPLGLDGAQVDLAVHTFFDVKPCTRQAVMQKPRYETRKDHRGMKHALVAPSIDRARVVGQSSGGGERLSIHVRPISASSVPRFTPVAPSLSRARIVGQNSGKGERLSIHICLHHCRIELVTVDVV